jgi:hypothetical protein
MKQKTSPDIPIFEQRTSSVHPNCIELALTFGHSLQSGSWRPWDNYWLVKQATRSQSASLLPRAVAFKFFFALTTWHPLSTKVGTNIDNKRRRSVRIVRSCIQATEIFFGPPIVICNLSSTFCLESCCCVIPVRHSRHSN